jgi:hypothetical protein
MWLDRLLPSLQRSSPATGHVTSVTDVTVTGNPTCCVSPALHGEYLLSMMLLPSRYTT